MIYSKSRKAGVTFIEIMLTVFMMGVILSSAFVAQSTVLEQLGRWSRSLRATLALRELFIHTAQDRLQGKSHPAQQKKQNLQITYDLTRPKKESSLAPLEDLHIEKATATWAQDQETIIGLLYKPEEKKKK